MIFDERDMFGDDDDRYDDDYGYPDFCNDDDEYDDMEIDRVYDRWRDDQDEWRD